MGTAGMAKGAISGGMAGFSGMRAGGGHTTLGALGSMFRHPGSMGAVMGGAATGARGAMGATFANDLGSAGRIIPGGGGMGRLIGGGGGTGDGGSAEEQAFHNAYVRESKGTVAELSDESQFGPPCEMGGKTPIVTPMAPPDKSPVASFSGNKAIKHISKNPSGNST